MACRYSNIIILKLEKVHVTKLTRSHNRIESIFDYTNACMLYRDK